MRPERFPVFYGWVIAATATLGIGTSMPGQTIGVSVFAPRLAESLGLSSLFLSLAYMAGTLLSALGLGAGGRFFDRAGARKAIVFSVFALGVVLIGLGFLEGVVDWIAKWSGASAGSPWPAFGALVAGFALLRFTGQGMLTMSCRAMLGKWFDKRRGTVSACSGAIVALLFSASPYFLEQMIRALGWQAAWQYMGLFLVLVMSVFFWVLARDNPEECGLRMDGDWKGKEKRANPDSTIYRDYPVAEARRTFSFWAFTALLGFNGLVGTGYAFHVLILGSELGVSDDFILSLFMFMAAVSVVSGFVVGWLTDQPFIRIKYILAVMGSALALGCLSLVWGNFTWTSWLVVLGFGLGNGCFSSLSVIVFPRFFGRAHLGAISGLFMTVVVVTSAIGPIFFSLADLLLGSHRAGFGFAALIAGALAVAALWADNPQRRLAGGARNGGNGNQE